MSLTQVPSGMLQTTAQYYGFKNRIINGGMQIAQRGTSSTPTSSGTFTCDRFILFATSGTAAVTQSTSAPAGFTNSTLWTQTSAGTRNTGDYFEIGQRIEGLNLSDLGYGTANAKTVTLSFWVQSSLTGTYALAFQTASGSGSTYVTTYTISAANTWQQITLTIPGATSGTWLTNNSIGMSVWWDLGSGATYQTSTLNTWQYSTSNALTTSTQVNFGQTSGATFYLTGVQLEVGTQATSFDYRPYGTELALCQRYLPCINTSANTDPIGPAYVYSTTNAIGMFSFLVQARVPPTGVYVSNGTYFTLDAVSSFTTSAVAFQLGGYYTAHLTLTASGLTAGQGARWRFNNAAGQIYFTGCEL